MLMSGRLSRSLSTSRNSALQPKHHPIVTIMSKTSSASNVDLGLRESPHIHQRDKQRDQSCHWAMTEEERDRSAPTESPSHERSAEDFEGRQSQPMSPGLGHRSASPSSEEALSDRDDSYGESYSSREYVDQSEDDNSIDDLDDNMRHDNEDNESSHLDDDVDGGNETPWSDEAANEEEYDMEEVISKDHVSQRRMQRIEIDKDDKRTLVPIADGNEPGQSMGDLPRCEVLPHASGTPSQNAFGHLNSSPSTPKGTTSSLQRQFEADSSRKVLFRDHFERSPSNRTLRTVTTLSADPSYDEDVEINERAVRKRILESFKPGVDDTGPAKKGFVYAFRDNDFPLIKFGSTAGTLKQRKSHIERKCGFVNGLTLVAAVEVKAYKQLEKIIHQDLAPHRIYFDCACGKTDNQKGFSRHQEYFQIDDNAALRTLQLWGEFVEQKPWMSHSHKHGWYFKVSESSKVESSETHTSHNERVKRWRNFFGIVLGSKIDIIEGQSTSPLTVRSTATERNILAGTTKVSPEGSTPSKPPRVSVEDVAGEDKPSITCPLLSGPLKRSPSSEPVSLTHVQDTHSTAREFTFRLPLRAKETKSVSDGQSLSENISLQARNASNGNNVRSAENESSSIFASTLQAPPYNNDSPKRTSSNTTLAASNGQSSPDRVAIAQESLVDGGPFKNFKTSPFRFMPVGDKQIPLMKPDSNANPNQSTGKTVSAPELDASKSLQHEAQPSPKTLPSQKQQEHAVTALSSPLVQSAFELAKSLLAKEVRPLPARAISDDLWQLRWPLACSVAFALQSPHIPAGLSFLMWSVFLPFFVAELRGWTFVGHA
jgi:hypothetical protein